MARILLIDDDPLVRSTLKDALEEAGHQVIEASDGIEGVAAFRHYAAEVVITDLLMPNKEGIETILELRRMRAGVKIIAISGGGRTRKIDLLNLARKLGADLVLAKPFLPEALLVAVTTAMTLPSRGDQGGSLVA